jgi:hypothetical protein
MRLVADIVSKVSFDKEVFATLERLAEWSPIESVNNNPLHPILDSGTRVEGCVHGQ